MSTLSPPEASKDAECEAVRDSTEPRDSQHRPSLLPAIGTLLLGLWCAMGLVFSAQRLASPSVGWRAERPAGAGGSIGLPLAEATSVSTIRELLAAAGGEEGAWLVVYPPDVGAVDLDYVRSQLLHLEYPRRIDLITTVMSPPLRSYRGVITHPRVNAGGSPPQPLTRNGFAVHPWKS